MPLPLYWLSYCPRVRRFAKDPVRPGDIVFLGDSITAWAKWSELLPDLPVRNFGIPGDTSAGILARLHQVTSGSPAKVFLLIGTNDLHFGKLSEDEVVANVARIVERLRTESPTTEIYVQSVMPRHLSRAEQVKRLNGKLEAATVSGDATWIDLWPILDDGRGCLRREYTWDRLHLRLAANRAWANHLHAFIRVVPNKAHQAS